MIPLAVYEWPERVDSSKARVIYGTVEWANTIFERLESTNLKDHLNWPKRIAGIVVNELEGGVCDGPCVLRLDLPIQCADEGSEGSTSPGMLEWIDRYWEEAVTR